MDLIPLCTDEYMQYLKAQKESEEPTNDSESPAPGFPACDLIPSRIGIGAPGKPALSTTDPDHTGYFYDGTTVSEGIYGTISRDDPELNSGEIVAARFLAGWHMTGGEQKWLEGGWAEYPDVFDDEDQHVYTQ